jgi:hypothetical protein
MIQARDESTYPVFGRGRHRESELSFFSRHSVLSYDERRLFKTDKTTITLRKMYADLLADCRMWEESGKKKGIT